MKLGYPRRIQIGFIVVLAAVASSPLWAFKALDGSGVGSSAGGTSIGDQRFAPLQRFLPRGGAVGYVTVVPPDEVMKHIPTTAEFYVAQYTLAPAVLLNTPEAPLVVGNLPNPKALAYALQTWNLKILEDAGNGVYLLGRASP